jgi:hypothetical protein
VTESTDTIVRTTINTEGTKDGITDPKNAIMIATDVKSVVTIARNVVTVAKTDVMIAVTTGDMAVVVKDRVTGIPGNRIKVINS